VISWNWNCVWAVKANTIFGKIRTLLFKCRPKGKCRKGPNPLNTKKVLSENPTFNHRLP
jgi:hypothetical protein